MTPKKCSKRFMPHKAAAGRSLIELLVAMLIGTLVLAGVMVVTSGSTTVERKADSQEGSLQTGQVALQMIANEIRMAGFSTPQYLFKPGYATKKLATTGIRGCDAGFTNASGESAVADDISKLTCAQSSGKSGVDSSAFSVVYEIDALNSITLDNSTTTPSAVDCRGFSDDSGSGLNTSSGKIKVDEAKGFDFSEDGSTTAYTLSAIENRYFVGETVDGDVALKCTGNTGTPYSSAVTLLRGVERMSIRYGVGDVLNVPDGNENVLTVSPNAIKYLTASEIDALGGAVDVRWQRVVSARVCLELRGAKSTANTGDKFINCEGTTTDITDGRQRRTVSMTVNLRNRTSTLPGGSIGVGGV